MNTGQKLIIEAVDLQDVDVLEDGIAPVLAKVSILSERVPTDGGGIPPGSPDTTQ